MHCTTWRGLLPVSDRIILILFSKWALSISQRSARKPHSVLLCSQRMTFIPWEAASKLSWWDMSPVWVKISSAPCRALLPKPAHRATTLTCDSRSSLPQEQDQHETVLGASWFAQSWLPRRQIHPVCITVPFQCAEAEASSMTKFQSSDKAVCSVKEKPPPASKPADYSSEKSVFVLHHQS